MLHALFGYLTSYWGLALLRLLACAVLFAVFTFRFIRKNGLAWLCLSFLTLALFCVGIPYLLSQEALPPFLCVSVTVCVSVLTAEILRYKNRKSAEKAADY